LLEPFFVTVKTFKKLRVQRIYYQLSTYILFTGHELQSGYTLADRPYDIGKLAEELECLILLLGKVKQVIDQVDQSARAVVANLKHLLALVGLSHSVTVLADDFFKFLF
jgi:hypothetical protein